MKLCVAFDLATKEECLNLAKELKGLDIWVKVGLRAYLRDGFKFIEEIKKISDFPIFLDLKIYDIPNTMADACEECAKLDVAMINIHASAGKIAMQEVMNRLNARAKRPLVLGVSALTSFDDENFYSVYKQNIEEAVINLSKLSYENGLDGMVCSVFESLAIKNNTGENFLTLTPGIRPFGENANDQKRVANLENARANKSDFIVVGRPIYKGENPRSLSEKILAELSQKSEKISEENIYNDLNEENLKEFCEFESVCKKENCNEFRHCFKLKESKKEALKEFYEKCGISNEL